jgi:hypothetical protein
VVTVEAKRYNITPLTVRDIKTIRGALGQYAEQMTEVYEKCKKEGRKDAFIYKGEAKRARRLINELTERGGVVTQSGR